MNDTVVFGDFTQDALDAQYNNRGIVHNHEEIMAGYAARGASFFDTSDAATDITFGPTPAEVLDVYPASPGNGNAPVLVFFHGGYWYSRHKDDFRFIPEHYSAAGVTVVVVNYALIPDIDMAELVRQCRASVAWVYNNIADHGGDPKRIYISGHSAGGHLTSMMFATNWAEWDTDPSAIAGGMAVSGLYDLEPIRHTFMNPTLGFTEETVTHFSPINLTSSVRAPLVVAVGGDETPEFQRHNAMLPQHWAASGITFEEMVVPGLNHFTVLGSFSTPGEAIYERTLRLMGLS